MTECHECPPPWAVPPGLSTDRFMEMSIEERVAAGCVRLEPEHWHLEEGDDGSD